MNGTGEGGDEPGEDMSKHRPQTIPSSFGLDPTLRDILNNNRLAVDEDIADVRADISSVRDEIAEVRGIALRTEGAAERAEKACKDSLAYSQRVANEFLQRHGYIQPSGVSTSEPSIPPMRGKLATKDELERLRSDADSSKQHLIDELDMVKQQQKALEEELERERVEKKNAETAAHIANLTAANAKLVADNAEVARAANARKREMPRRLRSFALALVAIVSAIVTALEELGVLHPHGH
jgi:hypothetical protein